MKRPEVAYVAPSQAIARYTYPAWQMRIIFPEYVSSKRVCHPIQKSERVCPNFSLYFNKLNMWQYQCEHKLAVGELLYIYTNPYTTHNAGKGQVPSIQ